MAEWRYAAAHGRKERDFVAGVEGRVPGNEFLVAGSEASATLEARAHMREQLVRCAAPQISDAEFRSWRHRPSTPATKSRSFLP